MDIVFNSDRTLAYVSRYNLDIINVIDVKRRKIIKKFHTGSGPTKMALTKDDLYLFVYNSLDGTELFVADTSSGRVQILDARTLGLKGQTSTASLPPFNVLPKNQNSSPAVLSSPVPSSS